jgi:hypothetical protein
MSSLSMGWGMLTKGATTVVQTASSKAAELSSNINTNEGSLLGSLTSKASEVGKTSWGGLQNFVKSPSLQGFTDAFKGGQQQYEDIGDPNSSSFMHPQSSPSLSSQYHGEIDSYNSNSTSHKLAPPTEKPRKKSPTTKKARSKNNSSNTDEESTSVSAPRKPKNKVKSHAPPPADDDEDLMIFAKAPLTQAKKAELQKQAEKEKACTKAWDDDAWNVLNEP